MDQILAGGNTEVVLEYPDQMILGGMSLVSEAVQVDIFRKMGVEVFFGIDSQIDLRLVGKPGFL